MPVGNHNFDAQSHKQLYDKIHSSADAALAQATNDAWLSFRAVMGNAKSEVESALRDAKVSWTGAASDSFGGGMAPLVQWAENARAAGVESHDAFQAQQSYYTGTRERMPEPVVVSSTANDDFFGIPAGMTHLVGGQTDQDVEEQRALEAKREAVRMMNGYQGGAAEAVSRVGAFTPPPTVTVEVPAPRVEQSVEQRQYSREFGERFGAGETTTQAASTPAPQTQQSAVVPPTGLAQGNAFPSPQTAQGSTHVSTSVAPLAAHHSPAGTTASSSTTSTPGRNVPGGTTTGGQSVGNMGPGARGGGSSGIGISTRGGGSGLGVDMRGGGPGIGTGTRGGGPGSSTPNGPTVSGRPEQPGQPVGRGKSGSSATEPALGVRPGLKGAAGMAMGGVPQGVQGEEDGEHKAAEYLQELDDVWGGDDVLVAPPVIGDDQR
ncbi:PPE domain-containing protein [Umezawaea tangerina]|uniref:PPE family protein n=1 Tax=Umezawaea tangerina TaxID=84725 RepID=A0A2T0SC81_9PSEU|nr:PPE domain-containing protein [Umezawaea tangerina]PRY31030.1 PPE family protein [Umezawaea tangerina]